MCVSNLLVVINCGIRDVVHPFGIYAKLATDLPSRVWRQVAACFPQKLSPRQGSSRLVRATIASSNCAVVLSYMMI